MQCPKCKSEIDNNSAFCSFCGVNIEKAKIQQNKDKSCSSNIQDNAPQIFLICVLIVLPCLAIMPHIDKNVFILIASVVVLVLTFKFCGQIKNAVLNISRSLLDFTTTFDALSSIIILVSGIYISQDSGIKYLWFVLGAIVYTILALVKDYVIYLLVDIRDSLKNISNHVDKK